LASGPVMAGVIGTRKFSYDVWGDPVNLASRLEGLSRPGRILVCPACRALLADRFAFESRELIEVKGVGRQETWFLAGSREAAASVFASSPAEAAPQLPPAARITASAKFGAGPERPGSFWK
jgi:adenylate cyclase